MRFKIKDGAKVTNKRMVKEYFILGWGLPEISKKHGIHVGTLWMRFHRLGLRLRNPKEAGQMKRLKNLERERSQIRKALEKWCFRPDDAFLTPEEDKEFDAVLDKSEKLNAAIRAIKAGASPKADRMKV